MNLASILIYYKTANREAKALASAIADWLMAKKAQVQLMEASDNPDFNLPQLDMAICLGGDGTILGLGRRLAGQNVPIFGVKFGKVGYLCSTSPENWRLDLEKILQKENYCQSFMALKWRLLRKGAEIEHGTAINDVVVSRGSLARLINIRILLNDQFFYALRGDGIICCSPLGSTGYNASAGGPILESSLSIMCLTPVCAFLSSKRPNVVPDNFKIKLVLEDAFNENYLTIDGQCGQKLCPNDEIEITGWQKAISLYKNNWLEFNEI